MTRRAIGVAACLTGFAVLGGCGKKGPPLPPLRPQPARITDLSARAVEARVELSILVPAENADGTTPSVTETIELYAVTRPAEPPAGPPAAVEPGAPPVQAAPAVPRVTAPDVVQPQNLVATATLEPPGPSAAAAEEPLPPVRTVVTHDLSAMLGALVPDERPPTVYYVAIGVGRGRRSPVSPVIEVPLARRPSAPTGLDVSFDAASLVISWAAPGEGIATHVDEVVGTETPPGTIRRSTEPIAETSFSLPVSFGDVRCFSARHVVVVGRATVEGPSAPAACVTPVDTFAPPAPAALVAIAEEGAVVLSWRGVSAADLAGYLVLRAEGANETLQPLTPSPVAERSYRDGTVRPGVTYTYAVVAVDRAQPPNRSQESNRQTVVAR